MALDPKIAFKTFESNSYRPLPKYLTIKDSDIDGLGLFASEESPPEPMPARLTLK
tara:strand:- start:68 stop:232 length:165 start_codon:yes stop_codon:yes gene_type:complete